MGARTVYGRVLNDHVFARRAVDRVAPRSSGRIETQPDEAIPSSGGRLLREERPRNDMYKISKPSAFAGGCII
jgi:hypothetical protein